MLDDVEVVGLGIFGQKEMTELPVPVDLRWDLMGEDGMTEQTGERTGNDFQLQLTFGSA